MCDAPFMDGRQRTEAVYRQSLTNEAFMPEELIAPQASVPDNAGATSTARTEVTEPAPDDMWKAYHEAGHAVADHVLCWELVRVSIVDDGNSGGRTESRVELPSGPTGILKLDLRENMLFSVLAGPAAQRAFARSSWEAQDGYYDLKHAEALLRDVRKIRGKATPELAHYEWRANEFIWERAGVIRTLAKALNKWKVLSGPQAHRIIAAEWRRLYGEPD